MSKYTYNIDPFRPINSATRIARYLGISRDNFVQCYQEPMRKSGCIWKKSGKKTSAWMTMPILLAMFFFNKAKLQNSQKIRK